MTVELTTDNVVVVRVSPEHFAVMELRSPEEIDDLVRKLHSCRIELRRRTAQAIKVASDVE